jgi:hypothetical protein
MSHKPSQLFPRLIHPITAILLVPPQSRRDCHLLSSFPPVVAQTVLCGTDTPKPFLPTSTAYVSKFPVDHNRFPSGTIIQIGASCCPFIASEPLELDGTTCLSDQELLVCLVGEGEEIERAALVTALAGKMEQASCRRIPPQNINDSRDFTDHPWYY